MERKIYDAYTTINDEFHFLVMYNSVSNTLDIYWFDINLILWIFIRLFMNSNKNLVKCDYGFSKRQEDQMAIKIGFVI